MIIMDKCTLVANQSTNCVGPLSLDPQDALSTEIIFKVFYLTIYRPSSRARRVHSRSLNACIQITGFVRGITKSYKVLYLFLKNKTSYKVLYFIEGLIFF